MAIDSLSRSTAQTKLGYDPLWFDSGLVDANLLQTQLATREDDEFSPTEHFRYAAFLQVLDTEPLPPARVTWLVRLIAVEPDRVMATSVLYRAVIDRQPPLSADQLETLRQAASREGEWLRACCERVLLRRRLKTEPLSDELLLCCLAHKEPKPDTSLFRALLRFELTEKQWQLLLPLAPSDLLSGWALQEYRRQTLLRRLRSEPLSWQLFDACLDSANGEVQQILVERDLTLEDLDVLSHRGATVRVRRSAERRATHQRHARR